MKTKENKGEELITENKIVVRPAGEELSLKGELPGVLCKGVQYYDLKDVLFISNTGLVNLVNLLRTLLKKGVDVQFVNVRDAIKKRIRSMGLDNILNCH